MNEQYAAGLIDGEGWIGITSRSRGQTYEINVKVSMSDKGIPSLKAMADLFGGDVHTDRDQTDIRRSTYRWALTGKAAAQALRQVEPYLLIKAEQCAVALELMNMVEAAPIGRGGGKKWSPEMSSRGEMLMLRIRELNRRGPDPQPPTLPNETPIAVYRWGWWWEPEDSLFGPVEFEGRMPTCGKMIAGHLYAMPTWQERAADASTASSPGMQPIPTPSVADSQGGHLTRSGDRNSELLLPGVAKYLAG